MDQWVSTWFIGVYWEIMWVSGGQWGSVVVSGIYWASEGLGSFGVSGGSLGVPIYYSRDLYILRYVVNINLMPEIYLAIEILRSVKMNKHNSFLKFVLNWIKNILSSFWGSMSGFILVQIFSLEIQKIFRKQNETAIPFNHYNIFIFALACLLR